MRAGKVVVVEPGRELQVAFFRVGVVTNIGPLAKGSLDEAFGFAVGAGECKGG